MVEKLYNLSLDIVEIYKIVSSLKFMLSEMNRLERFSKIEDDREMHDQQIKRTKALIQKIDQQVAEDIKTGLQHKGSFPK